MCLSRIGWPRRDGLTSYNRLSPRRIGVLHGSSTFSSSLLLSLSLCLWRTFDASRHLEFDRVSHAWRRRGCARALCTLFPWRGAGHPSRKKRSFVAGLSSDTGSSVRWTSPVCVRVFTAGENHSGGSLTGRLTRDKRYSLWSSRAWIYRGDSTKLFRWIKRGGIRDRCTRSNYRLLGTKMGDSLTVAGSIGG